MDVNDGNYLIELADEVSFLNKARILETLNKIPNGSVVTIDSSKSTYIHPDVEEIIQDFMTHASYSDIEVIKK